MKYTLLIFEKPEEMAKREGPQAQAYWAGWQAYTAAVQSAGVMAGGAGLQVPATATRVRLTPGKHEVQDGPYTDSKELLGGFYVIEAANLDEAIKWAARVPSPNGVVEIRPNLVM